MRYIPIIRPKKWYIVAVVKGRKYTDGPYKSEDEAKAMAWKNLSGVVFEVVPSEIQDRHKFDQTYRHKIWEETGDIESAVERMRHQP